MDISVIIVNWNAKKLLLECIESVLRDTEKMESEIIVVDNASIDNSVEAVKSKYFQVKIIENKENLGFAKANNIGIRLSKGKYVCLVNSDILVQNRCFQKMFNFMESNHDVGILGPKLLNTDLSSQSSCKKFPTIWNNLTRALFLHRLFPKSSFFSAEEMYYFNHDKRISVDALAGAFLMIRREPLFEIGLLDEDYFIYAEDIDLCKKFNKLNWKVIFYPQAVCIHHDGGSSQQAPMRFYIEMAKAKYKYWQKHNGIIRSIVFRLMFIFQNVLRITLQFMQYLFLKNNRNHYTFNIKKQFNLIFLKEILK